MTTQKNNKAMHISLWVAQAVLAAMFLMASVMKVSQPIEQLSQSLPWTKDVPEMLVRFIGTTEFLGALGLILPTLLKIKPVLTPIAAAALALVQVLATGFHVSRGENGMIGMNILLILIAVFIVWGRTKNAPIQPKS